MQAAIFVGLALLQGAISYVGGRVMASAMGGPTITDVKTWIAEAVAELEAFVSAELKQQLNDLVMKQMQADLEGIIQNIREYSELSDSNKSTNRFLIEYCDTKTGELVALSSIYPQALFISFTAMAYRLFSLFALYELDRDAGHIKSARPMVDQFIDKTINTSGEIARALEPSRRLGHYFQTTVFGSVIGTIRLDNNQVWLGSSNVYTGEGGVEEALNNAYTKLKNSVEDHHQRFIEGSNAAIKLTSVCFDQMCERIGETYPLREFLRKIPDVDIPSLVIMRGATIFTAI